MKISIDGAGLGAFKTGTSVYLSEILSVWNDDSSIEHEFVIFISEKAASHLHEIGLDDRFRFVFAPNQRHLRVLWQQLAMPLYMMRLNVDVHWGTGFVLPLVSGRPMVLTIHDLTFQLFPSVHEKIKRYYFPAVIKAGVSKARKILAVSESTRTDLYKLLPESAGKTEVTLLAARNFSSISSSIVPAEILEEDKYMLFIGTVEPRKNLSRLISAWLSLDSTVKNGCKLVIVGATGWLVDDLVGKLKDTDSVRLLGQISDSQLSDLLAGAMAFVYSSLYEGFGLPVVEAMAQGVPVLTSDVGATKEVADGAAVLVDPESIEDIREGLRRLFSEEELRESLAILGRQRASAFSWEKTAMKTLGLIEDAGRKE